MKGKIYVYPTDTVWGIGGNVHEPEMLKKVNNVKGASDVKELSYLFSEYEMLSGYFNINRFEKSWLLKLYSMQTTFALPVSWYKKLERKFDSDYIFTRLLFLDPIREIVKIEGAPIYTTSFNFSGEPPITKEADAKVLMNRIVPDAKFYNEKNELSGQSSTIITCSESLEFNILRKGERVDEIEKHLSVFPT